jgi:cephalosporin hydroxylase
VVHALQPDLIVETGVAHGGSLVFYASLCRLAGRGRVLGVDVDIRPPARRALESHPLAPYITLVEGDSADPATVAQVKTHVRPGERVMVVLDSSHARCHVMAELEAYCGIVTVGSYLVATDGYVAQLAGAPRGRRGWAWDNPETAVREFLARHPEFTLEPPSWPFNEGTGPAANVTYWSNGWLKRTR